jgi:hypothetical protein
MTSIRVPADPTTEALIQEVIAAECAGQVELPVTGTKCSDTSTAFQLVQQYAFANGFVVVDTMGFSATGTSVFICTLYQASKPKENYRRCCAEVHLEAWIKRVVRSIMYSIECRHLPMS